MIFPLIITLCLCGVFCLVPLAMYLTWLGAVNRRHRPTVVGGAWDFALALAGLSGFLVFGGGVLVAAVQSRFRYPSHGSWDLVQAAFEEEQWTWGSVAGGYLLVVAGVALFGLVTRARSLAVYNVDREKVEAAIDEVLAASGVPASRFGDVWSDGRGLVAIDAFQAFRHVTLKVVAPDPRLAEEIDRGLRARLPQLPPSDGLAAGWVYSAAVTCTVVSVLCLGLLGWFVYLIRG